MRALIGYNGEEVALRLADKEIRTQLATLIKKAQQHEAKACQVLKTIITKMS